MTEILKGLPRYEPDLANKFDLEYDYDMPVAVCHLAPSEGRYVLFSDVEKALGGWVSVAGLNAKECRLLRHFLLWAKERMSAAGCNDVDESVWAGWSLEERQAFCKAFEEWNGSPDDYDPNYLHLPDFAIVAFLASKITPSPPKETA